MALSLSASESQRFSLQIFRADAPQPAGAADFLRECLAAAADVVILRSDIGRMSALIPEFSRRCHTIVADALLEYRKVLSKKTVADHLDSGAKITIAGEQDRERLARLIRRCYSEYTNHYHANPCLDIAHVLDGFIEHSLSFLSGENRRRLSPPVGAGSDSCVLIASRGSEDCGYLCMDIKDGMGSSVFGGSALDIPASLRHKVLCDLTHQGDLWLMERGVTRFMAITRTDKTYIQKLLVHNMHTLPASTQVTLHLNLFAQAIAQRGVPSMAPGFDSDFSQDYAKVESVSFPVRKGTGIIGWKSFTIQGSDAIFNYRAAYDDQGLSAIRTGIFYLPKAF